MLAQCVPCYRDEKSDVVLIRKVKKGVEEIAKNSRHPLEKEVLRRKWGYWLFFLCSMTILMCTKPINLSSLNTFAFLQKMFFSSGTFFSGTITGIYLKSFAHTFEYIIDIYNRFYFMIHITVLLKNLILFFNFGSVTKKFT